MLQYYLTARVTDQTCCATTFYFSGLYIRNAVYGRKIQRNKKRDQHKTKPDQIKLNQTKQNKTNQKQK